MSSEDPVERVVALKAIAGLRYHVSTHRSDGSAFGSIPPFCVRGYVAPEGDVGKFAALPELTYLERLGRRNENLIGSHHPLRETLINQTGAPPARVATSCSARTMKAFGS